MRRRRTERAGQYESPTFRDLQARLASCVRRLRKRNTWTQEEAAARCEMSTPLYQRIEAGSSNFTATTLARLCDGFAVDVRKLLAPGVRARRRPRGRPAAT